MDSAAEKAAIKVLLAGMEAVERVRARELANMTDEEARRQLLAINIPFEPWKERPDWSGLVEQQAIFSRARRS
jgi:hypothetical protein